MEWISLAKALPELLVEYHFGDPEFKSEPVFIYLWVYDVTPMILLKDGEIVIGDEREEWLKAREGFRSDGGVWNPSIETAQLHYSPGNEKTWKPGDWRPLRRPGLFWLSESGRGLHRGKPSVASHWKPKRGTKRDAGMPINATEPPLHLKLGDHTDRGSSFRLPPYFVPPSEPPA